MSYNITLAPKLEVFLLSTGSYDKFIYNIRHEYNNKELLLSVNTISVAFRWSDTPEGKEYWRELSEQFFIHFYNK